MLSFDPVRYDETVPKRARVVVIGGGIVGVSTAYALALKGVPVVLCEKGRVGGEQSGRNWGWVRTMGRDRREIPLSIASLRLWREWSDAIEGETGFRQAGTMYLCDDDAALAEQEKWLVHARDFQLDTRLLDGKEVARLLPGGTRRFAGALHTPGDCRAEPLKAAPAFAAAAQAKGAVVLGECAARGIETRGGAVEAVVTERGRIACEAAVLAGGAWSRLFCGNLGVELPALTVLGSAMRTSPVEAPAEIAVGASDFAFRKRLDGGCTVARRGRNVVDIVPDSFRLFRQFLGALRDNRRELSLRFGRRFFEEWRRKRHWALDEPTAFEAVRVLDPPPADAVLDQGWANLTAAFPAFAGARPVERWAGLMDVTPDAVPVIAPVPRVPGFFIASGFSGHGFGIGPGAGRLMADLVTGDAPLVDPAPFALTRFA